MCACGFSNRSHRSHCLRCHQPASSVPAFPPSPPQQRAARAQPAAGQAAPRTPQPAAGRAKPTSPFHQAVLQEASRYQAAINTTSPGSTLATASSELVGEQERLQAELKKTESTVVALEAMTPDSDILALIAQKRLHLEAIRGKLHAARPLRSQLRAAEEARDKAVKKHSILNEEIIGMRLILEGKVAELAAAAAEAKTSNLVVAEVQSRMTVADGLQIAALPATAAVQAALRPIQIAALLANALDPGMRASFDSLMASVTVTPPAVSAIYIGSGDEHMKDPDELAAAAAASAANAAAAGASAAGSTAKAPLRTRSGPPLAAPFRSARARTDPYQRRKRNPVKEEPSDDGDGGRSRSDPEDRSVLSALGSYRSADTGLGGREGGTSTAPGK